MEVGRRLLYDSVTGEVLHDTGERAGDVSDRTSIQGEVNYLDLPYGQELDKFMRVIRYHIDPNTKVVIFDELHPPVVTPAQTIADLENQLLEANGVI